jgi:phospholipase C
LFLVTPDESGGYYDHVAPPAGKSKADGQPLGPRIYLIAVGPFAKKAYVSHARMEHSSILRFIEWNWLEGDTGQLGARDGLVEGIGSLLEPTKTGVPVP